MGKVSRSKFTRMRMPARGEENQKEQVWDTGIEKEKGREKEKEKKRKKRLQDKHLKIIIKKGPTKIKAECQKLTTVQSRPDLWLLPFLVLTSTDRQPAELL